MSIQRYKLIHGEMVPDDNGDICCADDVTEIEKRHCAVVDSHVYFSPEEFIELATFKMSNDCIEQSADTDIVNSVLDQIAIKCLGFDNWIQAYHKL
jgi:hypothetical protein